MAEHVNRKGGSSSRKRVPFLRQSALALVKLGDLARLVLISEPSTARALLIWPGVGILATSMLFKWASPQRDRFERMVEANYASLYGTALRLTRDREEANDLAQEALVRAYEAFDRFDGSNFKAWLLRILTNLYINRYRQKKRTSGNLSLDDDENTIQPMAPAEELPDRQMLDSMLAGEVEEALSSIPDVFRLAVVLSDIEGMSYDEIAEVMEVPVGTVRSRIARGRSALRQRLWDFAVEQGYIREKTDV